MPVFVTKSILASPLNNFVKIGRSVLDCTLFMIFPMFDAMYVLLLPSYILLDFLLEVLLAIVLFSIKKWVLCSTEKTYVGPWQELTLWKQRYVVLG